MKATTSGEPSLIALSFSTKNPTSASVSFLSKVLYKVRNLWPSKFKSFNNSRSLGL
jgi:hypothetical protein